MRQLKLRSAIFFRKNGLYVMALGCLAVLGVAAALLFSGNSETPQPVNRSDDERLSDVADAQASPEPSPTVWPSRAPWIMPTPHIVSPTSDPSLTPVPDFTVPPEETPDPLLEMLQSPVKGSVIRVFAVNSLIYSKTLGQWMTHPGVDIAAAKGDEVRAVLAGTVDRVYRDDMLGVTVVIRHENGLVSVYSSLKEEPPVSEGSSVDARQLIGYVGDTAIGECAERSHLHFELHYNGSPIDPAGLIIFDKE